MHTPDPAYDTIISKPVSTSHKGMENQINANNACVVKRFMTRKVTASLQNERLLLHLYTASFLPGIHTIHLPEAAWVVTG